MNNDPEYSISHLNDCGCCEGLTVKTPIEIYNRPSLQAIAYRIGEHPDFKTSMLARLSSTDFSNLKDLRTRNDNDFSIALLDAWSMVADVLTFYDQYHANEKYLRTATERLSIFELARLIGYKPRPGVAASTLLAFTMDEIPGSPEKINVPKGTKVQSTPGPDEQAQVFETVREIEARPAWNHIRPRLTTPQIPTDDSRALVFDGIDTGLKPGDGVMFTPAGGTGNPVFTTITAVELDPDRGHTRVRLTPPEGPPIQDSTATIEPIAKELPLQAGSYLGQTIAADNLTAEAGMKNFKTQDLFDTLTVKAPEAHSAMVFRQVASIFGHNAPDWESLPESLKGHIPIFKTKNNGQVIIKEFKPGPYINKENNWPGGKNDSLALLDPPKIMEVDGHTVKTGNFGYVFLDNLYKGVDVGSRLVFRDGENWGTYIIDDFTDTSHAAFTIISKVTRLGLDSSERFEDFSIRGTSVYLQSESLPLADVPIEEPIPEGSSQTLALDGFVDGLHKGQQVVLSGLEVGGTGHPVSEFITLEKIKHDLNPGGCTHISFSPALTRVYHRESVAINANVASATHGETVQEVLGSGDGTQAYQTFTLKQPPVTHVSAATPSGAASTLHIRVNDVLWHETDNLYEPGPKDQVFTTRINDDGKTIVQFGNGLTGERLPTGQDNVRAVYRKGTGTQGLVRAGQLDMLMSRPLGLKAVTNPHAPTGADDPESFTDARRNAPLGVLTLDRAVSLQDYEDFARAFEGIAKALAVSAPTGRSQTVFITVAGPHGALIEKDSPVYENLLQALAGAGDPLARFRVQSYRPVTFRFGGKVKIDSDFVAEKVLDEVDTALRATFSFDMREFGQPVALSEVVAVIQAIPGIVAVDVDFLYRGNIQKPEPRILAEAPVIKNNDQMQAAELLTLHPGPLDHLEVMA